MNIRKITAFLLTSSLLSSCMFNWNSYQLNRVEYKHPPCEEIFAEMAYANQFEKEIHANDKFMWRYLFVLPGIWETYQITKNQHDLKRRRHELELMAKAQNCHGHNPNHPPQTIHNTQTTYQPITSPQQLQYNNQTYQDQTSHDDRIFRTMQEERFYKKYEQQMLQY